MNKLLLIVTALLLFLSAKAQSYCDEAGYFIDSSSTSTLFAESIRYCTNCLDEEGIPGNYNILLYRPIDALNQAVPLRPHIMYLHGLAPNSGLADPLSIFAAAYMRQHFTSFGYSASALQYRQDIFGLTVPICNTPPIEVIKTHYRAIQDLRKAIHLLFQDPQQYGIDTTFFFLTGNSQGATVVMNGILATDESEWIERTMPDYAFLIDSLGGWAPRHKIAGILATAGALYDLSLLDETDEVPLFLAHGICDTIVPYKAGTFLNCPQVKTIHGSYEIACRAHELGHPYSLHSVAGLGHEWPDDVNNNALIIMREWMKNQILCGNPGQETFDYVAEETSCSFTSTSIDDCSLVATNEQTEVEKAFIVFPNPAVERLNLSLHHTEPVQLSLVDCFGRLVKSKRLDKRRSGEACQWDVGDLAGGIYLLTASRNGHVLGVQRVVLTK